MDRDYFQRLCRTMSLMIRCLSTSQMHSVSRRSPRHVIGFRATRMGLRRSSTCRLRAEFCDAGPCRRHALLVQDCPHGGVPRPLHGSLRITHYVVSTQMLTTARGTPTIPAKPTYS